MQPIPSPTEILLESPLYRRFERNDSKIFELEDFRGPIDVHCTICKSMSIFSREDKPRAPYAGASVVQTSQITSHHRTVKPNDFSMHFNCGRDKGHKLHFHFHVDEETLVKIGEFPARVDRMHPEIQKIAKVLGNYSKEYRNALMLESHGLGIGSFVYLRRVFEQVLRDVAIAKYSEDEAWLYDNWKHGKRVEDVIKDLSNELPDFVLETPELYPVLSKGIHELEEQECLGAFPIVKAALKEILDDLNKSHAKTVRRKGISNQIQSLKSRFGKK